MKNFPLILMGLFLFAFGAGCSQDSNEGGSSSPDSPTGVAMTLNIKVPGAVAPTTRALTEADENELKTIDLLIFKERDGDEYFDYSTTATSINNNAGSADKTFHATLLKSVGEDKHRIVVVANAHSEVNAALANIDKNTTKASALVKITFASDKRWNTKSSDDFTPLPMWGETQKLLSITGATTSESLGLVRLMRSVARVDVGLNFTDDQPQGFGDLFKIEDIYVYNALTRSAVAPVVGNLSTAGIAESPTLVTGAQVVTPPIAYAHKPADNGFLREIYLGEAHNKGVPNRDNLLCVVLGGYYTAPGSAAPSTQKTWYRIDFLNKTEYLDILRNHRYRMNIISVRGPGYPDPETAFHSLPINMETEIIAWEEGLMNDITFDGQYQLTVDKSEVVLYEEGTLNPQPLDVYTDHPDGWTVDTSECPWIHVTPVKGVGAAKATMKITADPYTGKNAPRTGWFWIRAGKLKKRIAVRQLNEPELTLEVTPTSLTFRKTGTLRTVTVTTFPEKQVVYFEKRDGLYPITWLSFPVTEKPNVQSYSFKPALNTAGKLLSTSVTVYVQDALGKVLSKVVNIQQLATDLLFQFATNNPYPATGGAQQFTVTSDTEWYIVRATGNTDMLEGTFDASLKNAGADVPYQFNLKPNASWAKKTLILEPGSGDPDFSGGKITLEQATAVPTLTASPTSVNLGSAATAPSSTISVTSNAQYRISVSSAWNNIVASTSPAVNQNIGTHTYTTTTDSEVTVVPKTYAAAAGTPAAGVLTGSATFSTVNHSGATAATQIVTYTRIVPAYFASAWLASKTIPGTGGSMNVSASTNAVWKVVPSLGYTASQTTASAFGTKTLTVTGIPANPTASARTVTFKVTYDTNNKTGATLTATQAAGDYLSSITAYFHLSNYPAAGAPAAQGVTITAVGNYSASIPVMLYDLNAKKYLNSAAVLKAPTNGGSSSMSLEIPANPSSEARSLSVGYKLKDNPYPTLLGTVVAVQAGTSTGGDDGKGIYLSTGVRVAATGTRGSTSWANACGLPLAYNAQTYGTADDWNLKIQPQVATGCGTYSEAPFSSGWRMPTATEAVEMMNKGLYAFATNALMSSYNHGGNFSLVYINSKLALGGKTGFTESAYGASLRCVHDVN